MMVPVGRLTIVRTFAKSELIRAMSFVAIPGLIGPMLGPIAGGLIVGYFHWRVIFFVNLPIGAAGLCLFTCICRTMGKVKSLDIVGLILFGSGVALLSYVLEVFGEHTLSVPEIVGFLGIFPSSAGRLWTSCEDGSVSVARSWLISNPHFPCGSERQLLYTSVASAAFRL